jgi:prepilin-type N-terminal cleavage/methylation domain-containing protein
MPHIGNSLAPCQLFSVHIDVKLTEPFGGSMRSSAINSNSPELGFTLVEIAIVLVIIGLLLGGILKGQEMIT